MKFSANIGFLWEHLPLPDRIDAAAVAGFDAVECHFPYEYQPSLLIERLGKHDIPILGLNTSLGPEGYFGLASVPDKQEEARKLIDQAIDYAVAIGAPNINVVAGLSKDKTTARRVYCQNLDYACRKAAAHGKTIVIEPLNPRSVANYHFSTVAEELRLSIRLTQLT